MDTKKIIFEIILVGLGWELLNHFVYQPFLARKAQQGKRAMWGNMLVILGVILMSMGFLFFSMIFFSRSETIDPVFLLIVLPFIAIGAPSLIIGILLINHSEKGL